MQRANTKQYYYEDDTMFFKFGLIDSRKYGLFIQSDSAMQMVTNPGAAVNYISPSYAHGTFATGVNTTQKTFKWKCAAEGLTLSEYKEMMTWLRVGAKGFLVRENNPHWGYSAIVDSVGDTTWFGNNVEFEIVFKTLGDSCATSTVDSLLQVHGNGGRVTSHSKSYINEYGIPEIIYDPTSTDGSTNTEDPTSTDDPTNTNIIGTAKVIQVSNMHSYLEFSFNCKDTSLGYLGIKINEKDCIQYKLKTAQAMKGKHNIYWYSKYGFCLYDNELFDNEFSFVNGFSKGIVALEGHEPQLLSKKPNYLLENECIVRVGDSETSTKVYWKEDYDNIVDTEFANNKFYLCSYNTISVEIYQNTDKTGIIVPNTTYLKITKHNYL